MYNMINITNIKPTLRVDITKGYMYINTDRDRGGATCGSGHTKVKSFTIAHRHVYPHMLPHNYIDKNNQLLYVIN